MKADQLSAIDMMYSMQVETQEIVKKINQIIALEFCNDILTEGEATAIKEIAKNCQGRAELFQRIRRNF